MDLVASCWNALLEKPWFIYDRTSVSKDRYFLYILIQICNHVLTHAALVNTAHILLQKFPLLCSFTVLTIPIRPGSMCHKALSFHDILQHLKHMSDRKSHLRTITRQMTISSHLSMRDACMVVAIAEGWISFNLKTLSITDSSVDVVSMPQKEHQSFTTMPAAITSEPRLTVPACNTYYNTLTFCVASYHPHRYITHQLKPFTHQCHIL